MPAFLGSVSIINIGGSAIVEFGDTAFISPISASKSNAGSGSGNTGALIININAISWTGTVETDLIDQPIVKNI
ncbi:spore germination protein [Neobacillus pocheonensis]|uniref:Spore germination protein n=1 Tax=Neobacillus pocheonensis TaxID=363869 RepID=A0ABT0WDZ2_9BACI|nr:spore germination protein [Neobacillus pocheonensis]